MPTDPIVYLVTGANGAIGQAICAGLARRPGAEVVMVGRSADRLDQAAAAVRRACGSEGVRVELADLGRKEEVDALGARWSGPLHVLVNNAAITPRTREETPEGIERQLAVNVLGYVWLTDALRDALSTSAPARVVDVASYWAGGLALDDLQFERRAYSTHAAYRQAKQANRMLAAARAERMVADGITVNACHPGDVDSKLSGVLGFGGHDSPEQGAATPLYLATESEIAGVTGRYFEHRRVVPDPYAADRDAVEALYAAISAWR